MSDDSSSSSYFFGESESESGPRKLTKNGSVANLKVSDTKNSQNRSSLPLVRFSSLKNLLKKRNKDGESKKEKVIPRKLLVLDLDETLIHTTPNKPESETLDYFTLNFDGEILYTIERPYCREFLELVERMFDVAIFTAGEKEYAQQILDEICPEIPESLRRYRGSVDYLYGKTFKDLESFNRDLEQVLIVDDNPDNAFFFPKNAITIAPFLGDEEDDFLMEKLLPILQKISVKSDMSKIIKSRKVKKLEKVIF
ncbi:NLI interacting factor-like phosphatase family protein [Tritrichomonas foetus]|uniref:Mitochondrial import inner membrane translocase subunit TIM50 n=1 Tax=Tritrichomonas foetus TaxID=1144522 RepID=A0A1J4JPK2_9EUKA|nr:NLI interacting factor-like phosphatase family protein [Tritrichomonas foetus]|eukprot:OHS99196.1 NLI interacting factor-like phosphatase family protein [Tritrichomonas foetus]